MNDADRQHYQELMATLRELQKSSLLDFLRRLEVLEQRHGLRVASRLPPLETAEEQDAVFADVKDRVSLLEAVMESEP